MGIISSAAMGCFCERQDSKNIEISKFGASFKALGKGDPNHQNVINLLNISSPFVKKGA